VHPFWSSHEEKWPWLELYVEGSHGRPRGARRRGREEGKRGGGGRGLGGGLVGELGVRPCCSVRYARERLMPTCRSVRAEDEKEERETKKKRKDNKRKKKIWKIF
jgi:hypothetical protein